MEEHQAAPENNKATYQKRKEEKEEQKELQKERMRRTEGQKRGGRTLRNWSSALVIVALIGYGLYLWIQSAAPQGEDFSRAVPVMEDSSHIPVGSALPEYTSNPPSSGPHYPQTARSGFRAQAIPDQNIIHNLEHGDVWIAFHPRIAENAENELKKFGAAKVIITPREANDTDIALIAWGRIDTFNLEGGTVPEERIRDFITRYLLKGPERIPGASGGI